MLPSMMHPQILP
jgi:hypothetical protein